MKQQSKTVHDILVTAFNRKKITHPGYSLRALARDLGMSAAFASNLISGKKNIPKNRLAKVCQVLELDIHEREEFLNAVLLGSLTLGLPDGRKRKNLSHRQSITSVNEGLLENWWNVAILEALTLKEPLNDISAIQSRLGLTAYQMSDAIQTLLKAGVIEVKQGKISKKALHLYVPTGRSKKAVRAIHRQFIDKAKSELETKTRDEDFQRRLINAFTFATSPVKIERLKKKILDFLDELSTEASEGSCSEVYQCNIQFFPLTKKLSREN